jgi:hypothetical protein
MNEPHLDPIVIMGIIIPLIPNRPCLHLLQRLLQPLYCLQRHLLELLEFGSRRSLPFTRDVVKGIVFVALIGH